VGCAGHARVHVGGRGDHPLDGKARADAREAGLAHPLPQRRIVEELHDGTRHRRVIARRHEKAVFAVDDDFRNTTRAGRGDRARARHRVEKRGAQAFGHRAQHEKIEPLDTAEHVGSESWQQHMLFQMVLANLPLERLSQLAFAQNNEACVGHLADNQVRGFDEMPLAFMRDERRDIADDGRLVREPERFVHVDRRRSDDVIDVDAVVHGHGVIGGHAVGEEHLPDRFGRRDEAVDLPVLPSRERIALQMEVDAAGRDQRPLGLASLITAGCGYATTSAQNS